MTKDKQKIFDDRDWWRAVGTIVDSRLQGFTERYHASFFGPDGHLFEMPGWLAVKLVELSTKGD